MTGAGIIKFLASTGVLSPVYFSICYAMGPSNEVCEGYIFTSVCLSTGGGCLPQCMLGYTPRRYGQQAGGTHPTGMHTCIY